MEKKITPWVYAIAIFGAGALRLVPLPHEPEIWLLAIELLRWELLWLRAWEICTGVGMALGDIPLAAFHALYGNEQEAEFQHNLYLARRAARESAHAW